MRTTDEIYNALVSSFSAFGGAAVTAGGDLSLRLRAVAAEIFSLEAQADYLSRQCFPQTAAGDSLDRHAALRGISRGAAHKAQGALRFAVNGSAAADVLIPRGTVCMTAAGTAFLTTEDGSIAAGTSACTVAAEAAEAGAGGNAGAGSIVYMMHAPTGVSSVGNPAAFSGGSDTESDDALRERVLNSYRRLPNGANVAYYETKVMDFDNVAAVTVLPRNRGIGTVDVIFATHNGVPTSDEISAVQSLLDSEREICVDLTVCAPTTHPVNVSAQLSLSDDADAETVLAAAEESVRAYFGGALLGAAVYRAKLSAILMAVEGVENCTLSAPTADLAAAEGTLPILGTLSITEAV